jgi:hypothetical protein
MFEHLYVCAYDVSSCGRVVTQALKEGHSKPVNYRRLSLYALCLSAFVHIL